MKTRSLLFWLGLSALLAASALVFPILISGGLFLGVLPGLILALAPTAFGYLCLFAIGWHGTRRFSHIAGFVTGLIIAGTVGVVPATVINARSASELAELRQTSVVPTRPIGRPSNVTILQPAYGGLYGERNSRETNCDDLCLVLLYGGDAQSVTMGSSSISDALAKERGHLPPITYRVEHQAACPNDVSVNSLHWQGWDQNQTLARLQFAIKARSAAGDCLVAEPARVTETSTVFNFSEADIPDKAKRFTRAHGGPTIRTLEVRIDGRLVARSVDIEATKLIIPLILMPEGHGVAVDGWLLARRRYLKAEPINSIIRLKALTGWSLDLPDSGVKDL